MPRFFISEQQINADTVTVLGDDAHHISRSLRMAAGEQITVCDGKGTEYLCELTDFLPDRVLAKILKSEPSQTEPSYRAQVFQALPKGDKLDSIIQKAVECGASELITFESERCIVRAKDGAEQKKLERRSRIALEAAKQCGRGMIPTVLPTVGFQQAVKLASMADIPLFCYEGEETQPLPLAIRGRLREMADRKEGLTVSVMVGSEGGFSPREAEMAKAAGMIAVGLGRRILRTETAAAFVLACISYEMELS